MFCNRNSFFVIWLSTGRTSDPNSLIESGTNTCFTYLLSYARSILYAKLIFYVWTCYRSKKTYRLCYQTVYLANILISRLIAFLLLIVHTKLNNNHYTLYLVNYNIHIKRKNCSGIILKLCGWKKPSQNKSHPSTNVINSDQSEAWFSSCVRVIKLARGAWPCFCLNYTK